MADNEEEETPSPAEKPQRPHRKARESTESITHALKRTIRAKSHQISLILKKTETQRTAEEKELLVQSPDVVERIEKRAIHRETAKQRVKEILDPPTVFAEKCDQLAEAIRQCKNIVVYTGAGISTAASIPDYRGPNGVWTLLQKGQQLEPQDLSDAEPTLTHMSIARLFRAGHVKHVVSQNCDGLHVRSGLPRKAMSEVHGNMYIEICHQCKPQIEYLRLFDVTERTGVRRHKTERECHHCKSLLKDTIVHFGEKGGLKSPYNWKEAAKSAKNCELILCLGTSLKILKRYSCLWRMYERPSKRPKLYIINLQWTPKDEMCTLKINGRCDEVMKRVMSKLDLKVPVYCREKDPLFRLAVPLINGEQNTTSKKILEVPFLIAASLKNKIEKKVKDSQESHNRVQPEANGLLQCCDNANEGPRTRTSSDISKSGCLSCENSETKYSACENSETKYSACENSETKYSAIRNLLNTPSFPEHLLKMDGSSINDNYPYPQKLADGSLIIPPYFPDTGSGSNLNQNLVNCWLMNGFLNPLANQQSFLNPLANQQSVQAILPQLGFLDPRNGGFEFGGVSSHLIGNFKPTSRLRTQTFSNPCNITIPQALPEIDHVLQDHCYLSKIQMQKLSPRRDKEDSPRSSRRLVRGKGQIESSSRKRCLSFDKCDNSDSETALNLCIRDNVNNKTNSKSFCTNCSDVRRQTCTPENPHSVSGDVHTNRTSVKEIKHEPTSPNDDLLQNVDITLPKVTEEIKQETKSDSEENEELKKHKPLTRTSSVPGWFGKGLNKKKKRRL
ncbi:hypothetical protein ScPMuIL_005052 [Solemya velum]